MLRLVKFAVFILLVIVPLAMGFANVVSNKQEPLPTLMVLPSLASTNTSTATLTPSDTPTSTSTATATATFTPTATLTATLTPTLSVRLLEVSAIMPGVYIPPTTSPFPQGTILLPAPPQPVEPLPDATNEPPPYAGWYSFESDNPQIRYSTPWQAKQIVEASRGQYHRSESVSSTVTFPFEGEGVRIRYVAALNMGMFDVIVDGNVIDTVDAYSAERAFPGTQVYFVGSGAHTLNIRSTQHKNNLSEGYVIGLDAIQVYRGTANTLIIPPPAETATPTILPIPASHIELVAAPATIQATATAIPPAELTLSVVIAYDENGNRAVDPAEGVRDISVRVVEVDSNHVIAQTFTNTQGYAELQIVTSEPVRVVVPYFGKVWDVPRGRTGGDSSFTLLLEPGNQPGLIP